MPFHLVSKKGVDHLWVGEDVDPDALSVHISAVEPGGRAHPPHTHGGVECFFMLEGRGRMEIGEDRIELGPNDGVIIQPDTLHGLVNVGDTPMRYMVILAH